MQQAYSIEFLKRLSMTNPADAKDLILTLKTGIARFEKFDFNRFRYFGSPKKKEMHTAVYADRDQQVYRWYNAISNTHDLRDKTKFGYAVDLAIYLNFVDSKRLDPESGLAAHAWEQYLVEKVRLGTIGVNTARKLNSSIKCLLKLLDLPVDEWFSTYGLFRKEDNPTESYSDHELKKLLRTIHPIFNQLIKQITLSPEKHLHANPRDYTALIVLNGRKVDVTGAITRCFSMGYFLMSYFTWGNTTTLLSMKKFNDGNISQKLVYSQSVLKSRANKYVTISIGENNEQHVPKYALNFIQKLLTLSKIVSADNTHLFYQVSRGRIQPLEPQHLNDAANWLLKNFPLIDDYGKPLKPMTRKFRASGSSRYLALTGDVIGTSSLLGNTPTTLARHYTIGNSIDNKQQLQAAVYTLEAATKCSDISESKNYAKRQLEVEVLPYEEFLRKYECFNKKPQSTVIGSGCKDPLGDEAELYRRKMNFSPKDLEVDHLACSDILKCFSCQNQVIIEEVDDIWCLMSFKQVIEDSLSDHVNSNQFNRNFRDLIEKIDFAIHRIDPMIRRKSALKLSREGRHPLWPEGINYYF